MTTSRRPGIEEAVEMRREPTLTHNTKTGSGGALPVDTCMTHFMWPLRLRQTPTCNPQPKPSDH